jgi:hypothetical protein
MAEAAVAAFTNAILWSEASNANECLVELERECAKLSHVPRWDSALIEATRLEREAVARCWSELLPGATLERAFALACTSSGAAHGPRGDTGATVVEGAPSSTRAPNGVRVGGQLKSFREESRWRRTSGTPPAGIPGRLEAKRSRPAPVRSRPVG